MEWARGLNKMRPDMLNYDWDWERVARKLRLYQKRLLGTRCKSRSTQGRGEPKEECLSTDVFEVPCQPLCEGELSHEEADEAVVVEDGEGGGGGERGCL